MNRRRGRTSDNAEELLRSLGHLVSQALETIKLQKARAELAVALQRHMLPPTLPVVSGVRIAARYAPSRDGLDVGGDWYDVFVMRDGSVGIAIGDVQGHDVEAVAFMGQVRTCMRAVANTTSDPGEVLARANDLLISMGCGLFATCSFLRLDMAVGEVTDARAGHVPMVWATAAGRCDVTLDDGGLPLGVLPGQRYPVTWRRLATPGVFVLVTDGVVEGPTFPIEDGLERIARLIRADFAAEPDDLAAKVIAVAELTGHKDDAAVLVIGYEGLPHGA